ncbi:MAG: Sensor protein, partial [uncultured bacterium]
YTFAELEERLKKLPDDTAVIWSIFFRDRENVFYEFDEGIERVVKACRVPVYCLWDFSIGYGAVGGYLSSGREQGTSVARMVLRYFAGEPFKNLPVRYEPVTLPIFEWQALQKHGIPLLQLPAGANIVGRPATIYQQYRWWVISGVSLIVTLALLSLILSYLVKVRTRQISIARDRAEAASRAKSQFLANMSHELRTPLNGVIGFTDLLQHARLDESEQKYLQNANMSARSLLGIINNILDFSKIEAGKLELELVKTDIRSLVDQTMSVVRYSADIKNLSIKTQLPDDLPCCAFVDPIRLGQILINLLGNAVKFTERGSVTLKLEFEEQSADNGAFTFSVIDTGIGISQENHRQIFEEFSQADNSSTRRYGGTGLGLTITRNLVEKMGGQLLFESEPGHGSRFYFSITTKYIKSRDVTNVKQQLSLKPSDKAHEILIVEDVSLNMLLLKEICARLAPAANLVEAVNGAEALEKYKKMPPHIIFMDLHMPDMDGYQACTEIRRYERENGLTRSAIIALTAGALTDEKEKCLAVGMNDFVTKPVEPSMIMAIIEKYSLNA